MSDQEREYLSKELGELSEKKKDIIVPWSSLLTSKPVWALIIAQLGHDWVIFFISSYIPKYFKVVLLLDFKTAGRYTALSYGIAYVFSIFCGGVGGYLVRNEITTVTFSRKFFTFLCKRIKCRLSKISCFTTDINIVLQRPLFRVFFLFWPRTFLAIAL